MTPSIPERGEVWIADLDPGRPGEHSGVRPVLVVSSGKFNAWPVALVIVVPITSRDRGFDHHVPVTGGGLDRPSFAMPEYLRSMVQERLRRRLGKVESSTMQLLEGWLRRNLLL